VQLAGDPLALVLLRRQHPRQQLAAFFFLLAQLPCHDVECYGDLSEFRVAVEILLAGGLAAADRPGALRQSREWPREHRRKNVGHAQSADECQAGEPEQISSHAVHLALDRFARETHADRALATALYGVGDVSDVAFIRPKRDQGKRLSGRDSVPRPKPRREGSTVVEPSEYGCCDEPEPLRYAQF
jgi:hypothetical protein